MIKLMNDADNFQNNNQPNTVQPSPDNTAVPLENKPAKSKRWQLYVVLIVIVIAVGSVVLYQVLKDDPTPEQNDAVAQVYQEPKSQSLPETENPFEQVLTLGDGKVTTSGPKKGYVYSCTDNFREGGATHVGDWVIGSQWDPKQKIHVEGNVDWPSASVSITTQGSSRIISSNGLPDHNTGLFPISRNDPAFKIDPNPNPILVQNIMYTLPLNPSIATTPSCTSLGPVGVMTNGVFIYNALDAAGKDAVAHEVQDTCDGHPQSQGAYHYHGYSSCLSSMSATEVIGYALDGYGITGPKKTDGTYFTSDDLDECHGVTGTIKWDGKDTEIYHYVMTADYPYSIGCFRGTPIRTTNR